IEVAFRSAQLAPRCRVLPAQPQVQREARRDLVIVLRERRVLLIAIIPRAQRRVGRALLESAQHVVGDGVAGENIADGYAAVGTVGGALRRTVKAQIAAESDIVS